MSALLEIIAHLLDALQLLMLSVGTLMYLVPKGLLFILFYNGTFLFIKILIVFRMTACMCTYTYHRITAGVIALIELLLSE
jgi:hypothetical protein